MTERPRGVAVLWRLVLIALLAACGGTRAVHREPPRASESPSSGSADAGARASVDADVPLPSRPGRLWRRDVVAVLSRGLGDFLSHLQVEPALAGGKFHGWRVVALRAGDPLWQGTDLAPGDIVTAINDRPIERPEQAFAAFQSLAVAKELRVTYERRGARRELVYPIDD
jgi:type II secretory pathway component PulC